MPRKESRHAIRSECLSDQPVVQTGQPRLHLSESIWKPDAALRLPVSNLRFRRNSEFISELGCSWPATLSYEPWRAVRAETRNQKSEAGKVRTQSSRVQARTGAGHSDFRIPISDFCAQRALRRKEGKRRGRQGRYV